MVRCLCVEMPLSIRGFTREDVNGNYTIIINANLSDEQKHRTYLHEMKHIKNDDFLKEKTVKEIEEGI